MGLPRLMEEMVRALTEEGERARQVATEGSAEGEMDTGGGTAAEVEGAPSSESEKTE